MKGLELARAYYETFGAPMIRAQFPEYAEIIAADKAYLAAPDSAKAVSSNEAANGKIEAMLKEETDELLDKVLSASSMGMKNAFSRADM